MMKRNILVLLVAVFSLVGCNDVFEPSVENNLTKDFMYKEASFAEGMIAVAYSQIPTNGYSFNEVATDDAVSNDPNNGYMRIATGQWASNNFFAVDRWNQCYSAILYLNTLIEESHKVNWANDEKARELFTIRMKGESYGLRALYYYYLLQSFGGWSGGQLMGVPLILEQQDKNSNFNLPRATYEQTVAQIYADIDEAVKLLPEVYVDMDIATQSVPAKYVEMGIPSTDVVLFNRVMGEKFKGRMNGLIAKAIKAQTALLAASPAFLDGAGTRWADAAIAAAELITKNGGASALSSAGATWYTDMPVINALDKGNNPPEILWRTSVGETNSLESNNYPPSLRGNGRVNPTQNLVDAFPTLTGYPISDPASNYNPATPYANRDPRLRRNILFNQSTFGPNNTIINITSGTTDDVMGKETGKSTRTGYYLRKLMKESTNLDPNNPKTEKNYFARIRYTEIYLIYAEAANEAYGPLGMAPGATYSAYDIVKAIRQRAGITGGDAYLESIKGDKEKMRQLIRNERRLELCFEGHRFWDLRRWKENLNVTARGIGINNGMVDLGALGLGVDIEARRFENYMYYGPIPLSETLKWSNLQQNTGW